MLRVLVMGVSGGGKSTLGRALAERLGAEFVDADDLHPQANIDHMKSGQPLTDEMRWPWLDVCGNEMKRMDRVVLACSALKRSYRDRLRDCVPDLQIVYPELTQEIVAARLALRQDHFMPTSLLASQFDTLEPPTSDENPILLDGTLDLAASIDAATQALSE
ncbi:MAG: gluconokinase [Octadecabacter sp.]|nr:gluconokinase [Octadecabacter sp.]